MDVSSSQPAQGVSFPWVWLPTIVCSVSAIKTASVLKGKYLQPSDLFILHEKAHLLYQQKSLP
jgi:hypothetical protein